MLIFEPIYTEGLAQISYLVGDSSAAVAAVIDPRRDIDIYVQRSRELGLRIAYVIETHIHADFASGAQALAARSGAELVGGVSDAYGFSLRQLQDGERLVLGQLMLEVLHTPGHTPEHLSLLLYDARQGSEPFALFTGDTLFNLDVGRPDLLGQGSERTLAAQLYHSLFDTYRQLGDRMEIYPCHGAGSACGKSIGDRRQSTLGNERLFNPALNEARDEQAFVDWLLADMPEPPRHYARLKKLNAAPASPGDGPGLPPPLSPQDFAEALDDLAAVQLVDLRSQLAFGGGHVPGALNIGAGSAFANWAGWMLDDRRPIYLIGESAAQVQEAVLALYRIGLDQIAGYLRGGMSDWQNAGRPLVGIGQWTVQELERQRQQQSLQLLDVRTEQEWRQGHVPGARQLFVAHLDERLGELDPGLPTVTYCGSGYRASLAASVLKRHGFAQVINVPGSWQAWSAAGLPVAQPD